MKNLIFVTSSVNKLKEAQEILGDEVSITNEKIDLPEIQTIDSEQLVESKVKEAYKIVKKPVFVEDTSIFFEAWNGLPGALIKWFWDSVGADGIVKMMANEKNRKVRAKTVIAFYNGKKMKTFIGEILGTIPPEPRGEGFGWDSIFIPDGYQETFGQLGQAKKNQISMRKIAFQNFKDFLRLED